MPRALSADTRAQIDKMLDMGMGPRAIAGTLCLHRTTIQRQKRKRAAEKRISWLTGAVDFDAIQRPPRTVLQDNSLNPVLAAQARALGAAKYGDFNWKPTPDANRPRAKAWGIANVVFAGLALGVLASALLSAYHNYIATP